MGLSPADRGRNGSFKDLTGKEASWYCADFQLYACSRWLDVKPQPPSETADELQQNTSPPAATISNSVDGTLNELLTVPAADDDGTVRIASTP